MSLMARFGVMLGGWSRQFAYDANTWERDREVAAEMHGSGRPEDEEENPRMKLIAQLLSADDILLELEAPNRTRVFEEVGRLFERRHGLPQQQVVEALSAREKLGSTGLGQGVALPHARIKKLPQAMAAYIHLKLPIPFDAPDAKPVSDMLVLLVPERATEEHLQILAEFAQMLGDPEFRAKIRHCGDADSVCRLFSAWAPS